MSAFSSPSRDAFGTVRLRPVDDWAEWSPRDRWVWEVFGPEGEQVGTLHSSPGADGFATALSLIGLARPHRLNAALELVRDGWDDGDLWGSALGALGAFYDVLGASVADLTFYADSDPQDGQIDSLTIDAAQMLQAGTVSRETLLLAVRTLDRYADVLRTAGLDY